MEKLFKNQSLLCGVALTMAMLPAFGQTKNAALNACAKVDGAGPPSQWVQVDSSGKLVYKTLPKGDRIMDFSSAGYMGGGVALPSVPARTNVKPSGTGDATSAIQAAIDAVSTMPLINGFRGAVVLAPGTYNVSGALQIAASGVVLRGSGSGTNGTVLHMTGSPHTFLSIQGSGSPQAVGNAASITDTYVPSGSSSFHVNSATGFRVGDAIIISRPVTAAWVHFMGMDTLVRNGSPQTWIKVGSALQTQRVIEAISGNQITLDVPLTDSFDSQFLDPPGSSVFKYTFPGRITQVGVEGLRVISPPQPGSLSQPANHFLRMDAVMDGWAKDIVAEETVDSLSVGSHAKQITVANVNITHTVATAGNAHPADFSVNGTQVLLDRCASNGDSLFFVTTGAQVQGPNVVLDGAFTGTGSATVASIQPHQRWATGLLVDRVNILHGAVDFLNRGTNGSGHGWAIGWAVAWNADASALTIQAPPGTENFCIGCKGATVQRAAPGGDGKPMPEGILDSQGTSVAPSSLYLSQLCHRLGPQAVSNIGH